MEFRTAQQPSSGGSSSAAYPRWVLLQQRCKSGAEAEGSSCSTSTAAAARTSAGYRIQVSLRLAEPPAASCVCVHLPDGVDAEYAGVVAAHGDSALVAVRLGHVHDNFVYSAGAAAADPPRPPSLSLLPPYYHEQSYPFNSAIGLMRRGEDELVVAELAMVAAKPVSADTPELILEPELFVFRSGSGGWSVERPRISSSGSGDGSELEEILSSWGWSASTVVPVGDRLLCWVDPSRGVIFCDVFDEERPRRLRYLLLPTDPCLKPETNLNVCAVPAAGGAGGATLKFVNVFRRCCCGGAGATRCPRSHDAYVINTWTLRMGTMEWVKDGAVDATELWALDAHEGLPRIPPDRPVVSMDEPHLVCFLLCEVHQNDHGNGDPTLWQLMVDTRSKTIESVSLYHGEPWDVPMDTLIPSNVSYYFNSCRDRMASMCQRQPVVVVDEDERPREEEEEDAANSVLQTCCKSSAAEMIDDMQASEIFEALEEIPSYGLDRDEMLKAYRILGQDKGRRFRSFLRLPLNSRKDWLLMEIRASEA